MATKQTADFGPVPEDLLSPSSVDIPPFPVDEKPSEVDEDPLTPFRREMQATAERMDASREASEKAAAEVKEGIEAMTWLLTQGQQQSADILAGKALPIVIGELSRAADRIVMSRVKGLFLVGGFAAVLLALVVLAAGLVVMDLTTPRINRIYLSPKDQQPSLFHPRGPDGRT